MPLPKVNAQVASSPSIELRSMDNLSLINLSESGSVDGGAVRGATPSQDYGSLAHLEVRSLDGSDIERRQKLREIIARGNRDGFANWTSYNDVSYSHGYKFILPHMYPDFYLGNIDHRLCFHNWSISSILTEADFLESESSLAPTCREILEKFKELTHRYRNGSVLEMFSIAASQVERDALARQIEVEDGVLHNLMGCVSYLGRRLCCPRSDQAADLEHF